MWDSWDDDQQQQDPQQQRPGNLGGFGGGFEDDQGPPQTPTKPSGGGGEGGRPGTGGVSGAPFDDNHDDDFGFLRSARSSSNPIRSSQGEVGGSGVSISLAQPTDSPRVYGSYDDPVDADRGGGTDSSLQETPAASARRVRNEDDDLAAIDSALDALGDSSPPGSWSGGDGRRGSDAVRGSSGNRHVRFGDGDEGDGSAQLSESGGRYASSRSTSATIEREKGLRADAVFPGASDGDGDSGGGSEFEFDDVAQIEMPASGRGGALQGGAASYNSVTRSSPTRNGPRNAFSSSSGSSSSATALEAARAKADALAAAEDSGDGGSDDGDGGESDRGGAITAGGFTTPPMDDAPSATQRGGLLDDDDDMAALLRSIEEIPDADERGADAFLDPDEDSSDDAVVDGRGGAGGDRSRPGEHDPPREARGGMWAKPQGQKEDSDNTKESPDDTIAMLSGEENSWDDDEHGGGGDGRGERGASQLHDSRATQRQLVHVDSSEEDADGVSRSRGSSPGERMDSLAVRGMDPAVSTPSSPRPGGRNGNGESREDGERDGGATGGGTRSSRTEDGHRRRGERGDAGTPRGDDDASHLSYVSDVDKASGSNRARGRRRRRADRRGGLATDPSARRSNEDRGSGTRHGRSRDDAAASGSVSARNAADGASGRDHGGGRRRRRRRSASRREDDRRTRREMEGQGAAADPTDAAIPGRKSQSPSPRALSRSSRSRSGSRSGSRAESGASAESVTSGSWSGSTAGAARSRSRSRSRGAAAIGSARSHGARSQSRGGFGSAEHGGEGARGSRSPSLSYDVSGYDESDEEWSRSRSHSRSRPQSRPQSRSHSRSQSRSRSRAHRRSESRGSTRSGRRALPPVFPQVDPNRARAAVRFDAVSCDRHLPVSQVWRPATCPLLRSVSGAFILGELTVVEDASTPQAGVQLLRIVADGVDPLDRPVRMDGSVWIDLDAANEAECRPFEADSGPRSGSADLAKSVTWDTDRVREGHARAIDLALQVRRKWTDAVRHVRWDCAPPVPRGEISLAAAVALHLQLAGGILGAVPSSSLSLSSTLSSSSSASTTTAAAARRGAAHDGGPAAGAPGAPGGSGGRIPGARAAAGPSWRDPVDLARILDVEYLLALPLADPDTDPEAALLSRVLLVAAPPPAPALVCVEWPGTSVLGSAARRRVAAALRRLARETGIAVAFASTDPARGDLAVADRAIVLVDGARGSGDPGSPAAKEVRHEAIITVVDAASDSVVHAHPVLADDAGLARAPRLPARSRAAGAVDADGRPVALGLWAQYGHLLSASARGIFARRLRRFFLVLVLFAAVGALLGLIFSDPGPAPPCAATDAAADAATDPSAGWRLATAVFAVASARVVSPGRARAALQHLRAPGSPAGAALHGATASFLAAATTSLVEDSLVAAAVALPSAAISGLPGGDPGASASSAPRLAPMFFAFLLSSHALGMAMRFSVWITGGAGSGSVLCGAYASIAVAAAAAGQPGGGAARDVGRAGLLGPAAVSWATGAYDAAAAELGAWALLWTIAAWAVSGRRVSTIWMREEQNAPALGALSQPRVPPPF